jgi:undecaprenyl-phosphate galactose phosphotransferase
MNAIVGVGHRVDDNHRRYARALRHWTVMGMLVLADIAAFATGYYLFRYGQQMPEILLPSSANTPNLASATDIYFIMGAIFVIARYIFGDYGRRQLFWDEARTTAATLSIVSLPDVFLVILLGRSTLYLPLVTSWLFLFLAIPLFRQSARWMMSKAGLWSIPTGLIGTGANAREVLFGLQNSLSLGFDVRFLVMTEPASAVPDVLLKLKRVVGNSPEAIVDTLRSSGCTQIVVAAEDTRAPFMTEIIQRLVGADIDLAIVPSLRGFPVYGLSTSYLFGKDILLLQVRNNLARIPSRIVKRIVDILGPLIVITLASPLLLAIAMAIKLDDGGPVLFIQRRVGRRGTTFPCLKFRTMSLNAEELLMRWRNENSGHYQEYVSNNFKLRDDPRVTRAGRWLRRTSLDELPQIVNVLLGDMSLVGPRPLIEREVPEYGAGFQLYQRTRPGITGLWQISGRSETRFADRVSYDEWYILNWSLWNDLVILLHTIWILCTRKGAF